MEQRAVHTGQAKFAIDLHPSAASNVLEAVREHLNDLLLRYNDSLEGVLLSYTGERLLSTEAKIHPYFPYFHVEVAANVVLYRPLKGFFLHGTVHQIGHDYIGMLVLGIFNGVIAREHIRSEFTCRILESCWASTVNRDHRIEVGTELNFRVHEVLHRGEFFSLAGSLLDPDTGAAEFLGRQALVRKDAAANGPLPADGAKHRKKKKKHKEDGELRADGGDTDRRSLPQANGLPAAGAEQQNGKKQKEMRHTASDEEGGRKRKKRKHEQQ